MKAPTLEELASFTLEKYLNLLHYLSQTYKIRPFCEIPQKDVPYLILRHDIDFSLPAALKMAKLEHDLGVRSSYFVLFSSPLYNVLEGNNMQILRQISNLGHEIGLHYHSSQFRVYGQNMNRTLKIEIRLLEHLLGNKVYSIARHGWWDRDPFATIKGYINANHPNFRGNLYVHDSCRAWTTLEGLYRLLNNPPRRAQLLIHPANWQDDKIDRETLLNRFIKSLETEISTLKEKTRKTWFTNLLVRKYDCLVKKEDNLELCERKRKINPTEKGEFHYYDRLFRWYMINSSLGWSLHLMLEKIRNIFKVHR